jgi:hypothetical protein
MNMLLQIMNKNKGAKSTKCIGNTDSWFIYQLKNILQYYWLLLTRGRMTEREYYEYLNSEQP